jgi:hypothetical protein
MLALSLLEFDGSTLRGWEAGCNVFSETTSYGLGLEDLVGALGDGGVRKSTPPYEDYGMSRAFFWAARRA